MTVTGVALTRAVVTDCVRSATMAPSLHNSQPWLFRIHGSAVDVYADPDRRLQVLDPDGREQLVSVGAAVFTLRLALRQAGYASDVDLFPVPGDADLVARVRVTHAAAVTPTVATLAAAIPLRHTNRWPFAGTPVPADVLDELRDAARWESTLLAQAGPDARDAILRMARQADNRLQARPGYRAELACWAGGGVRHDGVAAWAVGPWDALETMPVRGFAELSGMPQSRRRFEPCPEVLVLATVGDRRSDRVRAGQALQRVLLTATAKGLATMPISQPVEVPAVRRLLIDSRSGLTVQMVLRVGYGRAAGRTPRRPLTEVLLPHRSAARDDAASPGHD
jgi:nitroreductase